MMMKTLLHNWNWARRLRLVVSIIILVQAISVRDTVMGVAGIFLLGMALANVGCCGTGGCATKPYTKKGDQLMPEKVTYEEVVK